MPLEQLTLSDEQVQDIVASLITSGDNADAAYDDTNDTLTVSLSDSISVNTLEAIDSITDPEGNTVTSLSDPVRVTEEASTFTESNITVTNNNTSISLGAVSLSNSNGIFVDDWEDGDIAGWTGDTGKLTNQTATVLSGTRTGELTSNSSFSVVTSPSVGSVTQDLEFLARATNKTGNNGEGAIRVTPITSGGTDLGLLSFKGDGLIKWGGATQTDVRSWQADVTYKVRLTFDFPNDELDIIVDGNNEGTFDLANSVSSWDRIDWGNSTATSGQSNTCFIDSTVNATSGNALISFDSGVPTDIDSWDLATFQRTLDGETVTIDVEDSTGTVLKSDISKDTDISDTATSTDLQLRANLSRNDTSNNPTVDYLARRFTR